MRKNTIKKIILSLFGNSCRNGIKNDNREYGAKLCLTRKEQALTPAPNLKSILQYFVFHHTLFDNYHFH